MTPKVGDIIVDTDGDEAKVLAVLGEVFLSSRWRDFEIAGYWLTFKEVERYGWKIKGAVCPMCGK
jgi:hypothetical protein